MALNYSANRKAFYVSSLGLIMSQPPTVLKHMRQVGLFLKAPTINMSVLVYVRRQKQSAENSSLDLTRKYLETSGPKFHLLGGK